MVLSYVNVPNGHLKLIIISIALLSILSCILSPFRFAKRFDVGIIWYNLLVVAFVFVKIPLRILLPMFVVDPSAAVIGRMIPSFRWYGQKTVSHRFEFPS